MRNIAKFAVGLLMFSVTHSATAEKNNRGNILTDAVSSIVELTKDAGAIGKGSISSYKTRTEQRDRFDAHLLKIKKQIELSWKDYDLLGKNYESKVEIEVEPDGNVAGVSILTSSGSAPFDNAVINAVKAASPLEVPEQSIRSLFEHFEILISPDFNINDKFNLKGNRQQYNDNNNDNLQFEVNNDQPLLDSKEIIQQIKYDANPLRKEVVVQQGVNELIGISRGFLNRITTPFNKFLVRTTFSGELKQYGRDIYISTGSKTPVSIFLVPLDDKDKEIASDILLLTFVPKKIPAVDINIVTSEQAGFYSNDSRGWENKFRSPKSTAKNIFTLIINNRLPPGYKMSKNNKFNVNCSFNNALLAAINTQIILGFNYDIEVIKLTNKSNYKNIDFKTKDCLSNNAIAVSVWPNPSLLAPGKSVEIFRIIDKQKQLSHNFRPSSIGVRR